MKTSTILTTLAFPALLLATAAPDPQPAGSLEALLDRVSLPKRSENDGNKILNRVKRWVWATAILQDDTPAEGLPSAGTNANLLSNGIDVNTPTVSVAAPTIVAFVQASSSASPIARSRNTAEHRPKSRLISEHRPVSKRYVWATQILQDDTPTEGLPSVGANANLLSDSIAVTTPEVTAVAPTFAATSSVAAVTPTPVVASLDQVAQVAIAVTTSATPSAVSASSGSTEAYLGVAAAARQAAVAERKAALALASRQSAIAARKSAKAQSKRFHHENKH